MSEKFTVPAAAGKDGDGKRHRVTSIKERHGSCEVAGHVANVLFIVARDQPTLLDYVIRSFSDEPRIRVLVDRRQVHATRPDIDSRRRPEVDEQLKAIGYACVRLE
jgi:hypothetical protein